MKQDEKFEDGWDEGSLRRGLNIKKNVIIGSAGLLAVLGGFQFMSGHDTAHDARLLYIKQEYDKSLAMVDSILKDVDLQQEHEAALKIRSEIFLDRNAENYDLQRGFEALTGLFRERKSHDTARRAVVIGDQLKLTDRKLLAFIEFLANNNDIDSTQRVAQYYYSSNDDNVKMRSFKYFKMLPETTEKNIKLAELELMTGISNDTISKAERYLNSAVLMGSSEAMMEIAFLQLEKAKLDPFTGGKYKALFPKMVQRSIDMGYRGEKIKQAATIIKLGRFGVPQDQTLANTLEKIDSDNNHVSK